MHLSGAKLNLQGLETAVRMVDVSMADLETLHLKNNRLPKEAGRSTIVPLPCLIC